MSSTPTSNQTLQRNEIFTDEVRDEYETSAK